MFCFLAKMEDGDLPFTVLVYIIVGLSFALLGRIYRPVKIAVVLAFECEMLHGMPIQFLHILRFFALRNYVSVRPCFMME